MQRTPPPKNPDTREQLRASFSMLGFGLALLATLIAIDRPLWFALRPASGTAAALSKAAMPPARNPDSPSVGTSAQNPAPQNPPPQNPSSQSPSS